MTLRCLSILCIAVFFLVSCDDGLSSFNRENPADPSGNAYRPASPVSVDAAPADARVMEIEWITTDQGAAEYIVTRHFEQSAEEIVRVEAPQTVTYDTLNRPGIYAYSVVAESETGTVGDSTMSMPTLLNGWKGGPKLEGGWTFPEGNATQSVSLRAGPVFVQGSSHAYLYLPEEPRWARVPHPAPNQPVGSLTRSSDDQITYTFIRNADDNGAGELVLRVFDTAARSWSSVSLPESATYPFVRAFSAPMDDGYMLVTGRAVTGTGETAAEENIAFSWNPTTNAFASLAAPPNSIFDDAGPLSVSYDVIPAPPDGALALRKQSDDTQCVIFLHAEDRWESMSTCLDIYRGDSFRSIPYAEVGNDQILFAFDWYRSGGRFQSYTYLYDGATRSVTPVPRPDLPVPQAHATINEGGLAGLASGKGFVTLRLGPATEGGAAAWFDPSEKTWETGPIFSQGSTKVGRQKRPAQVFPLFNSDYSALAISRDGSATYLLGRFPDEAY